MAKQKTITIAGPRGLTIPAAVLGEPEDRKVPPHEGIEVPFAYGQHLVDDRFAVEVEPEAPEDLTKLTKEELLALAETRQVAVQPTMSKADLITALTA